MVGGDADPIVGRSFGEFSVVERIGQGGFATVYRARQAALDRDAVIKVLHTRLASRADVAQRFLREAKLASRLDHPFAAHVYAFGAEPDGTLWIAMELVRGTPMDQLLEQQGAMALDRFVPLFERICEVVQTAHERGLVHRDLKPANVMVMARAGRLVPKLLDFGIARLVDERPRVGTEPVVRSSSPSLPGTSVDVLDATMAAGAEGTGDTHSDADTDPGGEAVSTRAGAVLGSPMYMAPEQWTDAASAGPAADIYALGVMAYEALVGQPPFAATTMEEIMAAHARGTVPPLPGGLEMLDPVLARALAKNPADRYVNAGDFAAAVRLVTARGEADGLPELDEALRDALVAGAPQPIAEAIASLEAARNVDQACALLADIVTVVVRWVATLVLAARTKVGAGSDADSPRAQERLRALGRGDLADEEWLELARALTRPFASMREAHPLPELVALLHGTTDLTTTPPEGTLDGAPAFVDALHRMDALRGALERRAGMTDEHRRELYTRALGVMAELLRPLSFLLDYTVIQTRDRRAERWRGIRRHPRPAVVRRARPLPEQEVHLLDVDGRPVIRLSPLVQIAAPAPGKDTELFVFAGREARGARLVAVPHGFVIHDLELEAWFREHLLDFQTDGDAPVSDEVPPYRGLAPFTTADAAFYFGREREIDQVLNRLRVDPFLAIVGPSGSGKSSFVQAGVVPRAPADWSAIVVRPGASPESTLRARLDRAGIAVPSLELLGESLRRAAHTQGTTIVLVIDQFEELFTLCRDPDERAAYAAAIAGLARSDEDPVRVVITLRDDFLLRAESEPMLRGPLARGVKLLNTPAADDLERILVEPARRVGYQFEDRALAHEMVAEVSGRPGALALLSFTAAELWKLRDRHFHQLGRQAYQAIGGVGGALARHAEATLAEMSPDEQRLVREAFRALVTADGTRQVLQVAELRQLLGGGARCDAVIDRLVAARLVVVSEEANGEDRIEVIHEALLGAWPRLVSWRREDVEGARLRDQLRTAARQWEARGRPRGLLWRDDALAELQRWRSRYTGGLTDLELAFANAAQQVARRSIRARRALVTSAFVLLASALAGALWLTAQTRRERSRAVQALADLYQEQGRLELLADRPARALAYLVEAHEVGARGAALRIMIAAAAAPVEAAQHVLDAGGGNVWWIAYAPNGMYVATGTADGHVRLWNTATGALVRALEGHTKGIWWLAFSPDGSRLLAGALDGRLTIWDVGAASPPLVIKTAHEGITAAAWSPAGDRIVTASNEVHEGVGAIELWNATTGARLRTFDERDYTTHLEWSHDGTRLVSASDHAARVWSAEGEPLLVLAGHKARVNMARFSPDDRTLATASLDGTAALWDARTGERQLVMSGHTAEIKQVAFAPEGARLVTAGADNTARVWDVATGTSTVLAGHDGPVFTARFSPDGQLVVTAGEDGRARMWLASSGVPFAIRDGHAAAIRKAEFRADGAQLATASLDGRAILWRTSSDHAVSQTRLPEPANELALDDGAIVTLGATRAEWWAPTMQKLRTVSAPGRPLVRHSGLALDAAHDRYAYVDADHVIHVARYDGTRVSTLRGHTDDVWTIAFSPDGSQLLSGSSDFTARLWQLSTSASVAVLPHGDGTVFAAAFDAAGARFVTAANDGAARLWSARGELVRTRALAAGWIHRAQFQPAGSRVVLQVQSAKPVLWDLHDDALAVLDGHRDRVSSVQFSGDGRLLVSGSLDRTVRVWDVTHRKQLLALRGHSGAVQDVMFIDAQRLASIGSEGTLRIWQIPEDRRDGAALGALVRSRVPYEVDASGALVSRGLTAAYSR